MNNTAKDINSVLYRLRILSLASTFYKHETIVEQHVNYVQRHHGRLLFLCHSVWWSCQN